MKRYIRRKGLPRLTGSAEAARRYNHCYYMTVTRRKKRGKK